MIGRTRQRSGLAAGVKPQANDGQLQLFFSSLGPAFGVRFFVHFIYPESSRYLRLVITRLMSS